MRWALLWALALAGCFERGSASSRQDVEVGDDAAVAIAVGRALPEPPALSGPRDADATIRIRLEAEPAHLNPLVAGEAVALRVTMGDIYQGLLCRDRPGAEPTLCLAESVTADPSGRTLRVRLREARWHDGERLSAGDVVFTYRLLAPPAQVASWLAPSLDDLQQVRAVGEREIELVFGEPRPGRLELLADVPILPRHRFGSRADQLATADENREPVGTGPLRLARWTAGESIELVRFDDYWGEPAGAAQVVYEIVGSRARALAELATGGLDVAPQLPIDEALEAATESPELIAFGYRNPAYLAAVYDTRRTPLSDPRARRALTMLLDRPAVVARLLGGGADVVSGPYLPGSAAYDEEVLPLPFDRDGARELMRAVAPEPPRLSLLVPAGSRTMARVADIWSADARGVARLVVEQVPYVELLERVRDGRFDIALLAFSTARDPDLYSRFHSSQIGGENYGALADPELDTLLEAVRREPEVDRRAALQRAVHRRLHELAPYAFIATDVRAGLARDDIGGLAESAGLSARSLWRAR